MREVRIGQNSNDLPFFKKKLVFMFECLDDKITIFLPEKKQMKPQDKHLNLNISFHAFIFLGTIDMLIGLI